jgi:4-carboxymuconolactone decarboxylase
MMKRLATAACALLLAAPAFAQTADTPDMTIARAGSQLASKGPAPYFTGSARVDPLFPVRAPMATSGAYVTFEPGARSAWHTHPAGQVLIVTAGAGRVQRWGGPVQEIRPGDVVWTPPGVKHWHGAAPATAMTHIALQDTVNGKNVEWLEKVSDEQYGKEKPMMTPALEHYTQDLVLGELWQRPGLSPRDRSIVTLAVLVAKNQAQDLPFYLNRALDSGVRPGEIAELVTHLAFYSGWANATAADAALRTVLAQRQIDAAQLPPATPAPLPLDEKREAARAKNVAKNFGQTAPGVVQYTTEALFRDLWLRPGLAPRDRSLVTVSALVANGQVAQVTYHLNRAMDNGLLESQASEALTQLAFHAGWPNVFSAMPVFKDVFAKRKE